MEHSGGFAISTYDESHIEDNAEERFGLRYGDAADRADMMSLGLVDAKGKITDLDTLKATLPVIGKQCGGCHETYRVKNS